MPLFEIAEMVPPSLSVVATSRNDNHGGRLSQRTSAFIQNLEKLAFELSARVELVLVDWNPPAGAPLLREELGLEEHSSWLTIRYIVVPSEVHRSLGAASDLPLFQMIAKNVGIRRASAEMILATNVDVILSEELFRKVLGSTSRGIVFRSFRLDVDVNDSMLDSGDVTPEYCSNHWSTANGRSRSFSARSLQRRFRISRKLAHSLVRFASVVPPRIAILLRFLAWGTAGPSRIIKRGGFRPISADENMQEATSRNESPSYFQLAVSGVTQFLSQVRSEWRNPSPFTNAAGDFTLMHKDTWAQLQGYPEWPIYSWHLDSLLLWKARRMGIKEKIFGFGKPHFHVNHSPGSGYSADHPELLFERLENRRIPYLDDHDLSEAAKGISPLKPDYFASDQKAWGLPNNEKIREEVFS